MSTHSAPDRRGPDLGLGVFRASCSEPKAPRPLLAPASSKPHLMAFDHPFSLSPGCLAQPPFNHENLDNLIAFLCLGFFICKMGIKRYQLPGWLWAFPLFSPLWAQDSTQRVLGVPEMGLQS